MARPRLLALALALLTLLLYLPARQFDFLVYDDPDYVTQNPVVQAGITAAGLGWAFTAWHASNWHPLTWVSHMVDCDLFALDPGAHHLVNVFLHCLNAALTFIVLRRLTGLLWPSFIAAALFAWHPLHVQSVAWISERKDVLSTLFFVLTLWAYSNYAQAQHDANRASARKWWAAAFALFACGLLAKPMLVTVPFVLLLLDYWPLNRFCPWAKPQLAKLVIEKLPFLALSLASSIITFLAQRAEAVVALQPHPLSARVANALVSYVRYLFKTVWPVDLAIVYPLPAHWPAVTVAGSALLLAAVTATAVFWGRRKPHLLVGWLWFVGMLVPVIGLVQVGGQAMADRYTYVTLTGLFLAAAVEGDVLCRGMTGRRKSRKAIFLGSASILLLAAALATWWQLGFWRDSVSLFSRALAVTKDNALAEVNLGVALQERGEMQPAKKHYQAALRLRPDLAQVHNNLGNLLDAEGQPEQALPHYQEAVRLKPGATLARANLATVLSRLGRHEEADREFAQAAAASRMDSRPSYLWGKALLRAGRGTEAVERFRQALQLRPNDVQSLTWLARVLASDKNAAVRNGAQALELAQRAYALTGGEHPQVLDVLAMALAETGRYPEARQAVGAAIETLSKPGADPALLAEMRARARLYESSQPYRE